MPCFGANTVDACPASADSENSWCGPCKMLSPILEKLTDDAEGLKSGSGRPVDLVTVDTDVESELAHKYKVDNTHRPRAIH